MNTQGWEQGRRQNDLESGGGGGKILHKAPKHRVKGHQRLKKEWVKPYLSPVSGWDVTIWCSHLFGCVIYLKNSFYKGAL